MIRKEMSGKSRVAGGNMKVFLVQDAGVKGRKKSKNNLPNFTNIDSDDL